MKSGFFCAFALLTLGSGSSSCHKNAPPFEKRQGQDTTGNKDTTQSGQQLPPVYPHFVLFHLVRYRNTPVDLMPYLYPTKIANEKVLLNADNTPNPIAIRNFALTCKPHIPVTLDLETWPYSPPSDLNNTIDYFLNVIKYFKDVNITSPIGFYGVPPKQAYQWENVDPVNNPGGYANWKAISTKLGEVAAKVNIFLPSFYMYDSDTASWRKMVDVTVAEIKNEYSKVKPIYAYIWPQYHDRSDPYSLKFIDTAIWRYQLQVLYDRVNGCIIWTSNKDSNGNIISWNPDMPWWQTTKSFMVDKGLAPPFVLDSFYVKMTTGKVNVRWGTSADTTTKYFVVQHGKDTTHFENIGEPVVPYTNHYTENVYSFTDKNPFTGKTYYRLLIEDKKNNKRFTNNISTN